MTQKSPLPPFTEETAVQKVRMADDAWFRSYRNEN